MVHPNDNPPQEPEYTSKAGLKVPFPVTVTICVLCVAKNEYQTSSSVAPATPQLVFPGELCVAAAVVPAVDTQLACGVNKIAPEQLSFNGGGLITQMVNTPEVTVNGEPPPL